MEEATALILRDARPPVPTGPRPVKVLKDLSIKHRRIIALHMTGRFSNVDIAQAIGCSPATVSVVLNNPTVRVVLQRGREAMDTELRGMYPLAVERLRKIMRDGSDKDALSAIDKLFGVMKLYDNDDDGDRNKTAEDVVQAILAANKNRQVMEVTTPDGTQIRVGQE